MRPLVEGKAGAAGPVYPREQNTQWVSDQCIERKGAKKIGPDSSHWCSVIGQEATGANWNTGSSI